MSEQKNIFTCGLHVAKNMLAFMNINSKRGKNLIDLLQWKVSDFHRAQHFNAFIKTKNIENIFFKEELCEIHKEIKTSAFPHLEQNYLLNTNGVKDIKAFLLVVKCEMRCLLYRIRLLWNKKLWDEIIKKSDKTNIPHNDFFEESKFETIFIDNKILAYTNLRNFKNDSVGKKYETILKPIIDGNMWFPNLVKKSYSAKSSKFNTHLCHSTIGVSNNYYAFFDKERVNFPRFLENFNPNQNDNTGAVILSNKDFKSLFTLVDHIFETFLKENSSSNQWCSEILAIRKDLKDTVPPQLFINGTLFTQMAIMGNVEFDKQNKNGPMVSPHVDKDDIYTVYLTVGNVETGGQSVFLDEKSTYNVTKIPYSNYNIYMGQMDSIIHGACAWTGQRITLSFYCSKGIYNFFKRKGSIEIFRKYEELNFIRKQFVAIKYDSNTNCVSHHVCEFEPDINKCSHNFDEITNYQSKTDENPEKKRRRTRDRTKPIAGYYERKEKKYSSNQYRWTCVHDAILNASLCLNIELNKHKVYAVNPPNYEYVAVESVFDHDYIKENMEFIRLNMSNTKGGLNLNLLQLINKGVYFVCSKITKSCGKFWYHCFVYDSNYKDKETSCVGRLIDNDPTTRHKIIEHTDRVSKKSANNCLRDVYDNRCDITFIYEVRKTIKK